jgi:hypothetical protein
MARWGHEWFVLEEIWGLEDWLTVGAYRFSISCTNTGGIEGKDCPITSVSAERTGEAFESSWARSEGSPSGRSGREENTKVRSSLSYVMIFWSYLLMPFPRWLQKGLMKRKWSMAYTITPIDRTSGEELYHPFREYSKNVRLVCTYA